ncbi:MAG: glycosyltransferase family 2 protein [Gammaproteobacteria bacterium]|nr:glycosyltransferase family 2 protein [Gammaproteobacteria bacterium]MBU0786576.1 glycosyltransferase family 2 protein [Gammaproteobacteria bacterium]MBU0817184.1 glycosyltransferase family 2 protein [Gammaproteobacteria bacterium]MBU1787696.1 glycosyltransferase family 2 protein [Gammaproteobacteria bacterium]
MSFTDKSRTQLAQRMDRIMVSIVVPVYNERDVLPSLYARLNKVLEQLKLNYEIVMVDDGSQDGSVEFLFDLVGRSSAVKVVCLSRNFGKEAAMTAGIDQALGDAIIILDADLQDPPELIPKMLMAFNGGADIVAMKRRSREGDSLAKRLSALLYYRLLKRISHVEIPQDTGDFRLMSRRAITALQNLPERNRYMKGLFAWVGFPTHVIEYDREPRAAGETKWNFFSLLSLAFEGITSFSIAPLRWAASLGLLVATISFLFGAWMLSSSLLLDVPADGNSSLAVLITFMGGGQLMFIGLVGEYVGKTYYEAKQRPLYVIRDVLQKQPVYSQATSRTEGVHHAVSK